MKVTLVKGRFTYTLVGAMVRVSCGICAYAEKRRAAGKFTNEDEARLFLQSLMPRRLALEEADALLEAERTKTGSTPITSDRPAQHASPNYKGGKGLDRQLELRAEMLQPDPNTMKYFIVTPVVVNGRIEGMRPILCSACRQVGLMYFEADRISPDRFGVVMTGLNVNPQVHALRRMEVSYCVLRILDVLAVGGLIRPTAMVACPGASIQAPGKKGKGKQDAHQVLRELTVGGCVLYKLEGLTPQLIKVLVYCHSVVSHLDDKYNRADCLVERAMTIDFLDLAHMIISGRLRRETGSERHFRRLLWYLLAIRYYYACRIAVVDAGGDLELIGVLQEYIGWVGPVRLAEPPDLMLADLDPLCRTVASDMT